MTNSAAISPTNEPLGEGQSAAGISELWPARANITAGSWQRR